MTPELDRDVTLLASSPPNEVVLDVVQELACLIAVLVNTGAEHSLEDVHCLFGRHKWHCRDHIEKVEQDRVLRARFISISLLSQTDSDLDVTEYVNEGSGS